MVAPIPDDVIKALCDSYISGLTIVEVAKKHNVDYTTARKYLHKNKVPVQKPSQYTRHYYCNEHFFDVIDNEAKAYWLGMLAADGSIQHPKDGGQNVVQFGLKASDVRHVESFKKALSSTYPVHVHFYDRRSLATIGARSNILCNALALYGVVPNKAPKLLFPQLPEHLMPHYIRGYFDGDGCVHTVKGTTKISVSFTSICYPFLHQLQTHLANHCGVSINTMYRRKQTRVCRLSFSGKPANFVASYMYANATIYLPRKWNIVRQGLGFHSGTPKEVVPQFLHNQLLSILKRWVFERTVCEQYRSGITISQSAINHSVSEWKIIQILNRYNIPRHYGKKPPV